MIITHKIINILNLLALIFGKDNFRIKKGFLKMSIFYFCYVNGLKIYNFIK